MSGVTLTVKRSKSLMPKIKAAFQDYEVSAGVLSSAGDYPNGESVASVAAVNEYGGGTIPERPAFRTSFFKNRKKYLKELNKIAAWCFKGRKNKRSHFEAIGKEAKRDIETSISSGGWKANAISTQIKKGGGKQLINDPLIDTSRLLDSIDYKVKKK